MSRRRGCIDCCPRDCIIFEDDFDRDNSTDLGNLWDEVAGDSEISAYRLLVPAGGLVAGTTLHPKFSTPTALAWVDVPGEFSSPAAQVGEIYRVIVNYVDANNYVYGELEVIGGGYVEIRACTRVGGSDTILDEDTVAIAPDYNYLRICRSLTGIYVQYEGNEEIVAWGCIDEWNGGRKAGVANGGPGTVYFDNFVYSEHKHTNPICPECLCECEGKCLSKTLKATVMYAQDECECLDGVVIPLNYVDEPEFVWKGSADVCPFEPIGPDVTWNLALSCDGGCPLKGGLFPLTDDDSSGLGPAQCNGYNNWSDDPVYPFTCPVSIQCDPLIITYGPFWCWVNEEEETRCAFLIVVTEA